MDPLVVAQKCFRPRALSACPECALLTLPQRRMVDPVLAADGCSYEREAVREWLKGHSTSPVTGAPLEHQNLVPNRALRNLLQSTRDSSGR